MKECKYCRECIYYHRCVSNAPERMQCKLKYGSCVGFLAVCCENFVDRKSIDDIYEEQKRTESKYEPEDDIDLDILFDDLDLDILEDDELPF